MMVKVFALPGLHRLASRLGVDFLNDFTVQQIEFVLADKHSTSEKDWMWACPHSRLWVLCGALRTLRAVFLCGAAGSARVRQGQRDPGDSQPHEP